ncbi:phage terminase small subunit P27 family [Mesorhizobium sp. M0496]|uniref:phage terminase small subunit P27 family n=1 Tax=Mesorhizobium sp. M0496 TaxID=2956952 RepID=UPI003337D656
MRAIDGGLKGVPRVPDYIPEAMAGEWKVIAADMARRKILTSSALGVLSTYVIALWSVRQAQAAIAKHGVLIKGAHQALKPNPACGLLSKSLEAVARLGAELGVTPASRSKAGFQTKGGPTDDGAPTGLDL